MNINNVNDLYMIVKDFFGYRSQMLYADSEKKEVGCILYNSFLFKCNINGDYGTFGGGISLGNEEAYIIDFLGRQLSLNSDKESIVNSLKVVDEYCQLRLPDKFLNKFKHVYEEQYYD